MSTGTHRPERYQLGGALGLQAFRWWNHPGLTNISFSDIDFWQHSFKGNRHLFGDFKTTNEGLSRMGGQLDGLMELSKLPGAQVLIVFDPYHGYEIRDEINLDTEIRIELLRNGHFQNMGPTTIRGLQDATSEWRKNKGPLRQPVPAYRGVLTRFKQATRMTPDDALKGLGLANIYSKDWNASSADRERQAKWRDDVARAHGYAKRPEGWVEPNTFKASDIIAEQRRRGGTELDTARALAEAKAKGTLLLA